MTLPPCYVSKFLVEADGGWTGAFVLMLVGEGNVTLDLCRAVSVWLATILINMPSSTAQHTAMEIHAPFFSVPVVLAPLALRG